MRPVTRDAVPNNSPYAIRLNTMVSLQVDASQPPNWKFSVDSVIRALKTNTPSRWDLLQAEWYLATGTVPPANPGWTLPALLNAYATINRRLTKGAKGCNKAGPLLTGMFGEFCSFCEQYLPGHLVVQHCTPMSPFPYFTLCWDNLLLACEACNGSTGMLDKLTRDEVDRWGTYADDCARNVAIRGTPGNPATARYLWPDLNPLAYRNLVPYLTFWGNNQWNVLPFGESVKIGSAITQSSLANRHITATIFCNGTWYQNQTVMVQTSPLDQQALDSVNYYGFGRTGIGPGEIADCRMYNRTCTWFKAISFIGRLTSEPFDSVWPLIVRTAGQSGFYSVWIRVLHLMGGAGVFVPSDPTISYMQQFITDMAAYYPNTNTTAVP
ncbi:hypothetical protein [Streptosporangium sp. NPDC000396]|uniref:hypothetical protein n=1 Tax=Streptosporangium sp. NPDC000396 TaxID=3366185 RepID=UPI0036992DB4